LPFSIPVVVGFIAVAGIPVLNGVVIAGELVGAHPDVEKMAWFVHAIPA